MSDEQIQDATLAQQEAPAQPAAPSLSLQDLVLAMQTIQACAQRGAVRAEEMSIVGGLYDRMFAFLEAQGVIKKGEEVPAEGTPNA
jgi:hypothetical protein